MMKLPSLSCSECVRNSSLDQKTSKKTKLNANMNLNELRIVWGRLKRQTALGEENADETLETTELSNLKNAFERFDSKVLCG